MGDRSTPTVGVIVNPAAGRDIRRLTGGASVSDNYAKRRTATCVLQGLTLAPDRIRALVMPDRADLGQRLVGGADDIDADVSLLDMQITGTPKDTRNAAEQFSDVADCVVVLGGDGTNRDVSTTIGDVPMVSISTGTNNVVPTPIDGTVAGAAAGLVATDVVDIEAVTQRHGTIEATIDGKAGSGTVSGLATMGLLDRPFIGTRAVLDVSEFVGGAVSRAFPTEIGLSGIAGGIQTCAPDDAGGLGLRFGDGPDADAHTVRAITVPGVVNTVSVSECVRIESGEPWTVSIDRGVVTADGEREREVSDAEVTFTVSDAGPQIVTIPAVFQQAVDRGVLSMQPIEQKR
ncbi:NAD(+)/NADH kinase [Natronocalculus amylovorans]|uniref:NAD(+)/NADH kinase n=1 Tax=Natronocalculus amylovorans TaxID=2917812 RepID=A0AAE3K942_9EURY|nr:NAD(+)/NADH kinase [Natronocalculus amylovorans]MCL9817693.1 NAD(+)/NADH kinase [Natronocalculus amylovorans]